MGAAARPPYLEGAYLVPEKVGSFEEHPFCLPWVRDFDLTLSAAVTFVIETALCCLTAARRKASGRVDRLPKYTTARSPSSSSWWCLAPTPRPAAARLPPGVRGVRSS